MNRPMRMAASGRLYRWRERYTTEEAVAAVYGYREEDVTGEGAAWNSGIVNSSDDGITLWSSWSFDPQTGVFSVDGETFIRNAKVNARLDTDYGSVFDWEGYVIDQTTDSTNPEMNNIYTVWYAEIYWGGRDSDDDRVRWFAETRYQTYTVREATTETVWHTSGYVYSIDPNAYPNGGWKNGYYYDSRTAV